MGSGGNSDRTTKMEGGGKACDHKGDQGGRQGR